MKRIIPALIVGIVLSQLAMSERPPNEIPMYGGEYNPTVDENPVMSQDATSRGWKAYYQGDFDTAIKRFNQGWMFNRENPDVYWGFGLIMGQRASTEETEKNLKESIRFLQMATDKKPDDGRIIGDLAFSHTILGHYFESEKRDKQASKKQFEKADALFPQAFKLNSKYPPIVASWSIFYFYTGQYQEAKSKADEAIKMGYKFSPDYMTDLKEKQK